MSGATTLAMENTRPVAPEQSSCDVDRPLRIALVHTADFGGGAEASTLSLHRSLRQLGHESYLFVGTKRTNHADVIEIPRHRCFPGVLRGAQFLEQQFGWQYLYHPWFRKIDQLFPADIDVTHFHSLWGGQHGYADVGGLPRLTKRFPSLITLRDMWMLTGHCACPPLNCDRWQHGCGQCPDLKTAPAIPQDGTAFNWKRKQAAIQRSPLRVVTVSDWLGDRARQSPIFAGKEVHTVYNGVDHTVFTPQDRTSARQRWELPQDAMIVMIAGQSVEGWFEDGRGPGNYALQAIQDCERDVFLLAVGHSAEKILAQWGGSGRAIPFQADAAELAALYNAADIVLVASLWETFGRIPAEAQMCGRPVVGFATGGIPEIVEHDSTGLLVPPRDVAGLAVALQTLTDRPELRHAMGAAAVPRARSRFSDRVIAEQYVRHYRDVIAQRRAALPVRVR
ncbi:MAG TPA: glycosyltransferase [Planctomycetaceae bacterium]|nr:glycosyltransferase [Planctomycetaceae bacterium]